MNKQVAIEEYKALNNMGHGYAVGEQDDDINEIQGIGQLVAKAHSDSDIALYRSEDGIYTGVGNANGPWAIQLTSGY